MGETLGHCCLVTVSPQVSTPGRSRQQARLLIRPAVLHDSSGIRVRACLQFSLLPISWAQSFFTGPQLRRVREFFLVSSPRGELHWTSDHTLSSPLFILAGMEQLLPVDGTLGGQSHLARARTVTLVAGFKVGRQAAGSSHLFHFQRAPSGVQGSGDVRVKVQHRAFSFYISRSPGLSLYLSGLDCTVCGILLSFLTSC
ncbi:hypothetical protein NDU88_007083 [Pleurodeles waltl]|uniref:Uncharacterized protein n=1 Tax=Pleurodeles waltl TaxID=8319 RepID=A0AAV7SRP6_PLEWA|nr:hypothetical protein NDU88_007083 [Pleurodeles waltl]